MGGCADRESKFVKIKKKSDLSALEEFESETKKEWAGKSMDQKISEIENKLKRLKDKNGTPKNSSENEPGKLEKQNGASKSLLIVLQPESDANLISPTNKSNRFLFDQCQNLSIDNKKFKFSVETNTATTAPLLNHCDKVFIESPKASKSQKKINHCESLLIPPSNPHSESQKSLKISSVLSQSIFPPLKEIFQHSRPISPEPENTKISYKPTTFPLILTNSLQTLPNLPVYQLSPREKTQKNLKTHTEHLQIPSPRSLKLKNKKTNTDFLPELSPINSTETFPDPFSENPFTPKDQLSETPFTASSVAKDLKRSKTSSINLHIYKYNDTILSPPTPTSPVDPFLHEKTGSEESLRRVSIESYEDYNKSYYRKLTDVRDFKPRSSLKLSIDSIPEEAPKRSERKGLTVKISEPDISLFRDHSKSKHVYRAQSSKEL